MSQRVQRSTKNQAAEAESGDENVEASRLYGVAMLKIAMELKKPEAKDLDDILSGVLERMRIPESEFRAFLFRNGGLLRTLAQRKRY